MSQGSRAISPNRPARIPHIAERNLASASNDFRGASADIADRRSFVTETPVSPTPNASLSSALSEPHPPITQISSRPSTPPVSLNKLLHQAAALLDANEVSHAVRLLASVPIEESDDNHKYQALFAQAHLAQIDVLNSAGRLGPALLAASIRDGQVTISALSAERLDCYRAVCKGYVRYLTILRAPETRADFISVYGEETLNTCETGVKAGLQHALLEVRHFLNRISQCNSNLASSGFVTRMIATGRLHEEDVIVRNYREVQADPLYAQFITMGKGVAEALRETDESATFVWQEWSNREHSRILGQSEVASAVSIVNKMEGLGEIF